MTNTSQHNGANDWGNEIRIATQSKLFYLLIMQRMTRGFSDSMEFESNWGIFCVIFDLTLIYSITNIEMMVLYQHAKRKMQSSYVLSTQAWRNLAVNMFI